MARDLKIGESHTDRDEFVEVVKMSLEAAYKAIFSGEIIDGKSIIAIQYAYYQRERL